MVLSFAGRLAGVSAKSRSQQSPSGRRLLRKRRKRPRRRAAEECDELAPLMGSPQAEDGTLPQDHTYHTVEEAVLCIAAFWPTRLPQRVKNCCYRGATAMAGSP